MPGPDLAPGVGLPVERQRDLRQGLARRPPLDLHARRRHRRPHFGGAFAPGQHRVRRPRRRRWRGAHAGHRREQGRRGRRGQPGDGVFHAPRADRLHQHPRRLQPERRRVKIRIPHRRLYVLYDALGRPRGRRLHGRSPGHVRLRRATHDGEVPRVVVHVPGDALHDGDARLFADARFHHLWRPPRDYRRALLHRRRHGAGAPRQGAHRSGD
mmetsp:Transcript_23389/g.79010  ORF Transcript_23389/g.79010 Transcript_23389/m.79010 type:complete len:212 (+) Transcript_23389:770-1405(+)